MKGYFLLLVLLYCNLEVTAQEIQSLVFSGGKNFVGKDVIQVEYGLNFERQIKSISSIDQQISQYALVKYGVNKGLDFSLTYNYAQEQIFVSDQMRRSNGLSNLAAGFKKKISRNFSFQSNVGFSQDENGKTLGSFQIFGISEHPIDNYLTWENNLGINWANGSPEANLMYLSGITFSVPYPMDFILEIYGQYGRAAWNNYTNLGLGYYFTADLMLEAYVGYGNTLNQQNTFFSLNFYWRLVPARYFEE